jgi:hypothetical protein
VNPADASDTRENPAIEDRSPQRKRLVRNRRHRERYGPRHRRRRREWQARIRRGEPVACCRCGQPIGDDQTWELDHDDVDPEVEAPAHRACNWAAPNRVRTSRVW